MEGPEAPQEGGHTETGTLYTYIVLAAMFVPPSSLCLVNSPHTGAMSRRAGEAWTGLAGDGKENPIGGRARACNNGRK